MHPKLNLKLEVQNQRKFPISSKFFSLKKAGKKVEDVSWINLYIVIQDDIITFFLDTNPIAKSSLYYGEAPIPEVDESNVHLVVNKILFSTELILLPNGFPWYFSDRTERFKDLSEDTKCVIFWPGPYEIKISSTYQFFDNIIEMLMRP